MRTVSYVLLCVQAAILAIPTFCGLVMGLNCAGANVAVHVWALDRRLVHALAKTCQWSIRPEESVTPVVARCGSWCSTVNCWVHSHRHTIVTRHFLDGSIRSSHIHS